MRTIPVRGIAAGAALAAMAAVCAVHAADRGGRPPQPRLAPPASRPVAPHYATTSLDTVLVAHYTFDAPGGGPDPQGWTIHDLTTNEATFFHVDDFAGLGGGVTGMLTPIAGNQSMWCGARPTSPPDDLCSYATLPGYGNDWKQELVSRTFPVAGDVTLSFDAVFDSEAGYDFTYVEYKSKSGEWQSLFAEMDQDSLGYPATGTYGALVPGDSLAGTVEFRFRFESDNVMSDEDGGHPQWGPFDSDGAVILDNIQVIDATGVVEYEDFEGEGVGDTATTDADWIGRATPGFGSYAALFNGLQVLQEDPLVSNVTHFWGFFDGSPSNYACGGFPTQPSVPYGIEWSSSIPQRAIRNAVRSPWTPIPSGRGLLLAFDVYKDLDLLGGLVFYEWAVRFRVGGCAGAWQDSNTVYYGDDKAWYRHVQDITDFIPEGASDIQVRIGVRDMCPNWCSIYAPGPVCHSHAPLIDNVSVLSYEVPTGIKPAPATGNALHPNVPNPFNPMTAITYEVAPGAGRVTIAVYDVAGRLVKRLVDDVVPGGVWEVSWDGKDTAGQQVSSGVYFYQMRAGDFVETRKMVLLK